MKKQHEATTELDLRWDGFMKQTENDLTSVKTRVVWEAAALRRPPWWINLIFLNQ